MKISVPKKYFSLIFFGLILLVALVGSIIYSIVENSTSYSHDSQENDLETQTQYTPPNQQVLTSNNYGDNTTSSTAEALMSMFTWMLPLVLIFGFIAPIVVRIFGD